MNLTGVISYPIPAYQNVPIQPQFYQPSRFQISNVVLGQTTTVTTTTNMNYVIGNLIRLLIPPQFGCYELNEAKGYILSLPAANQVEIAIDSSRNVSTFTSATVSNQPQIIAIGDINTGAQNANGRVNMNLNIPGSFLNISPI